jgi:hypothetical protein
MMLALVVDQLEGGNHTLDASPLSGEIDIVCVISYKGDRISGFLTSSSAGRNPRDRFRALHPVPGVMPMDIDGSC